MPHGKVGRVSASHPLVYEMPDGPAVGLDLPARVWAAQKGTPAADAETAWVAHVMERVSRTMSTIAGDIAFRLDVALAEDVARRNTLYPLYKNDLENYLSPIAKRFPDRVVSVWATKTRGERSYARVEAARPAARPAWKEFAVRRARGAEDLREAVRGAVVPASELPEGPVGLQASFVISDKRPRASSIWKCALDGLGPLLGLVKPHEPNNPLDDRIVRIGLHHRRDEMVGEHEIDQTVIWATPAPDHWPELAWLAAMSDAERDDYWRHYRERLACDRALPALASTPRARRRRTRPLPAGLIELESVDAFEVAISEGAAIINKSEAFPPKLHIRPGLCSGLQLRHFVQTVIDGGKRNGRYFRTDDPEVARRAWPNLRDCAICETIVAAE